MLLDPTDPAAQAFIADYLNDWPMADFDEAAHQSDAYQCDGCQRWFTERHDLNDHHECEACEIEEGYDPIRRAWVR